MSAYTQFSIDELLPVLPLKNDAYLREKGGRELWCTPIEQK